MLFVILAIATLFALAWAALLLMPTQEDWAVAAYNKVHDNIAKIDLLREKDEKNIRQLAEYSGFMATVMKVFLSGDSEKEIAKILERNEMIKSGNMRHVGIIDMPGYVLVRRFESIGKGELHKTILTRIIELHGKKHAENKAKQILARLVSYPILGVAVSLLIGSIIMIQDFVIGAVVISVGTLLVLIVVYAMYDDLEDKANKRREAIMRQFPNVVSKLALLVTSGMIMDRAWKETAFSQEQELYREMRKTSEELDNLVSPEVAYSTFISRCNTKETTKLASAIMQNLSKGNAEIGRLLKDMAKEAWNERRHLAKRDSEAAKSKLMLPSILLLLSILVMIMVPIAIGFQGM